MFLFDALARRRPRCRLAPATFLAAGVATSLLWLAWPARAANFDVANDAQLRSAISRAGNGDTITFKANITLSSNLPTVTQNVGFNGGNFTLSGDNKYRGLFVQSGTVGINDLTITNAIAQGGKGGDAWHSGGGGGGAGLGGALFVAAGAHATVQNVSLQNSAARGGDGGNGIGAFGAGGGGGGYWPAGADGGNAGNGSGGAGGGGAADGNGNASFGGGGGGGTVGGSGGFGGGGGGSWDKSVPGSSGGFLAGPGGPSVGNGGGGGGGGSGFGGAIFVQEGGVLTLAGSLSISGNSVAGSNGGLGGGSNNGGDGSSGGAAGPGIFLHGNGTLTLAPGAAALTQTISDAIVDQSGAGGTGANAGSWSVVKSGAGTTILTGVNAYSGGTVVQLGTLKVASDTNLGAAGKGVTLINNGRLWTSETMTIARPISLQGTGGVFQVDVGKTLTLTGVIDGTNLTMVSGVDSILDRGTLILAGTATYTGNISIYGGIVQGNTSTLRGNIAFGDSEIPGRVTFDQATDGTFAGSITGLGSLYKIGAGKLILSGDNTYNYRTYVGAGILQGTSRSLQGTIVNDATVIFDQAFNGTFAGQIFGKGSLIKNGSGTLNLTDTNDARGGTTINDGGLAVNGHLTSNVTLNKGGSLSGVGNITGDITNNGGSIKPGNSIGHLKVDGNFTHNSGTYEVEVNAKGDSDRISVVGADHKVMIKAGTLQIVAEPGTYVPNTTYTIITTEGGGTVAFDTVTGGVGFLTPKVSLDREHIYVSLVLAPNAFRSAGQTVNQQAVGGALDAIAAGGNVGGLVAAMASLNPSQGAPAFQALSGQPYADFGTVNVQASQMFMNAVGRQMAVARGAGVGVAPSVALAEACTVACDAGADAPPRFSAWLSGIGSTGSVAGDNNAAGLTYTLGGTAFGIDYRLDPRFLLGIAGSYLGGQQWVNGFAGNGYSDALSIALYGSFTPSGPAGGFYADVLAGYANASNRLQRVVSIPGLQTAIANGNTSANQFLGQVETGYKFGVSLPGNMSISPFGRLQIGSINQAGFTESGSSLFNLAVASQTTTSVRTTFGADFGTRLDLGRGTPLDLGLRLGWMHEFADTTRPMTAGFAAAPGGQFTVFGATPARDSAVIGFSAAMALNDRTSLFASYDGEVGGGTNNHQLRAGFRLTW